MDTDIIKRVLEGQTDEFNKLIEKYYNELFVFVFNNVNNIETTKDLLQEIFMRLYSKLTKYNPSKASFRTWMYKVASNYLYSYLRKNKFIISDTDLTTIKSEEDIIECCFKKDDVSYVLSIMKKVLNQTHFQIVILHFFSDLTVSEIASTMNKAEKTVRNVITLSLQKIRKEIGGSSL